MSSYAPSYDSALPAVRHYIGKDQTYRIEQNNSRQRHWFARFKRRSVVVTRSLPMLEVTMRLFATFHANENDVPLLEMASSAIGYHSLIETFLVPQALTPVVPPLLSGSLLIQH